jgi:signal peptidase I
VKRCTGIAGDVLEIRGGVVYINGRMQDQPFHSQLLYQVTTRGQVLDAAIMKEMYAVDISNAQEVTTVDKNVFEMLLTPEAAIKMKTNGLALEVKPLLDPKGDPKYKGTLFPYTEKLLWTLDDYGPVWIPRKGSTLQLTAENYALYERAIRVYEHNKLESNGDQFFINGKAQQTYTFKMDYYWMMGDNRHQSQDSRFWGFVPETHIVGKPSVIWFSFENGPRWNRLFKTVR